MVPPHAIASGVALAVLLTPSVAAAANQAKPRTPVVWSAGACATVVDRSTTVVVHFEYAVADEDVGPRTEDEVADSRTHQFFAFRRLDYAAVGTAQRLPPWITNADITRAAMVDPDVVPADIVAVDVLETTPRFTASEWTRVTADDARVPISDAQAALGVDWDVAAMSPGVYTIWGYTWEPLTNLWVARPGFVKLIASASEADDVGPAIALLEDDAQVTVGEVYAVAGCADVPAGSTVTLEWGAVEGPLEPEWHSLIVDEPITSGALELDLVLPDDAMDDAPGESRVRLRATVTDASGKRHVTHSPGSYEVIAGEGPAPEGCGCRAGDERPRTPWMLVLAVLSTVFGRSQSRVTRRTREFD